MKQNSLSITRLLSQSLCRCRLLAEIERGKKDSDSPQLWSLIAEHNAPSQREDLESVKDLIDLFHKQLRLTLHHSLICCCWAGAGVSSNRAERRLCLHSDWLWEVGRGSSTTNSLWFNLKWKRVNAHFFRMLNWLLNVVLKFCVAIF